MKAQRQVGELGWERWCPGCEEWWPEDEEFFYVQVKSDGRTMMTCLACRRDRMAEAARKARAGGPGRWPSRTSVA